MQLRRWRIARSSSRACVQQIPQSHETRAPLRALSLMLARGKDLFSIIASQQKE